MEGDKEKIVVLKELEFLFPIGLDEINKMSHAELKQVTDGRRPKYTDDPIGCVPDDLAHTCFRHYHPSQTGTYSPSPCWLRGLLPILTGKVVCIDPQYSDPRYRQLARMGREKRLEMLRDFFFQNEGKKEYFARYDWGRWYNPIVLAVKTNFTQAIPVLLVAGFIIDAVSLPYVPVTGLYLAVLQMKEDSVKILLKAGAKANKKSKKKGYYINALAGARKEETPFELAERLSCTGKKHKRIFKLFSE